MSGCPLRSGSDHWIRSLGWVVPLPIPFSSPPPSRGPKNGELGHETGSLVTEWIGGGGTHKQRGEAVPHTGNMGGCGVGGNGKYSPFPFLGGFGAGEEGVGIRLLPVAPTSIFWANTGCIAENKAEGGEGGRPQKEGGNRDSGRRPSNGMDGWVEGAREGERRIKKAGCTL